MIDIEIKVGCDDGGIVLHFDENMIVMTPIAEGWLTAEEARAASAALLMMAMIAENGGA